LEWRNSPTRRLYVPRSRLAPAPARPPSVPSPSIPLGAAVTSSHIRFSSPLFFSLIFDHRMAKRSRKKKQRMPTLSDDLIVESLCRVPYRSLCRFKCVSRSWLALCSDPDIRKKSPQTLSGFFCYARDRDDGCCSGLLLCSGWKSSCSGFDDYVVCNPATQKWTVLPDTGEQPNVVHTFCLGFDPSMPSRFYVFLFVRDSSRDLGRVKIYSSETGAWISRQHEWGDSIRLKDDVVPVFFNGTLYAVTSGLSLITVDTEGTTWRKIRMPHRSLRTRFEEVEVFIAHSQGRLYATHIDFHEDNVLSVWQFEADGNEQWSLKHTASITRLLGRRKNGYNEYYQVISAHPERNLILLTGGMGDELLAFDLDNQEVRAICTLEKYFQAPMLPYIPCFAEWPSDGR
ncbi:hypothetical protein EJB05_06192, partial [Eragrostis curvula]